MLLLLRGERRSSPTLTSERFWLEEAKNKPRRQKNKPKASPRFTPQSYWSTSSRGNLAGWRRPLAAGCSPLLFKGERAIHHGDPYSPGGLFSKRGFFVFLLCFCFQHKTFAWGLLARLKAFSRDTLGQGSMDNPPQAELPGGPGPQTHLCRQPHFAPLVQGFSPR